MTISYTNMYIVRGCTEHTSQGAWGWPGGLPGQHQRGGMHRGEALLLQLHIHVNAVKNTNTINQWTILIQIPNKLVAERTSTCITMQAWPFAPIFLLTSKTTNLIFEYNTCPFPGRLFARPASPSAASGVAATWIWQQLPSHPECGKYQNFIWSLANIKFLSGVRQISNVASGVWQMWPEFGISDEANIKH